MYKKVITGFFLILLIGPLAGWVAGINVELDENRKLAGMSGFSAENFYNRKFFSAFEEYFNDHFAFRSVLITMKSWVDYYVFKTSPSPKVHVGTDGWLYYYRTTHGYFKVDDCIPVERERMERIAEQLHLLERMVETSGRKFLFVVAPDKTTIYPEYFGEKRRNLRCSKSHYDLLLYYLQKYPVRNFVRLDEDLISEKRGQQIYYKTDTHWNLYGSMIASSSIIRHLEPVTWREYFPWVNMSEQSYRGDLSKMIALDISEQTMIIENIDYNADVKEVNLGRYMNGDRFRFIASPHSGRHLLPKAIIYRDSFSTRLLPFLKGSFERLDVVWSNNVMTRLTPEPVDDLRNANIVIVEVAEMYLPGFAIDLQAWNDGLFSKN